MSFVQQSHLVNRQSGLLSNIQRNLRKLGIIGIEYDKRLVKQSKAVGVAEDEFQELGIFNTYTGTGYIGTEINDKKFIAFYDTEYPVRRDFLRRFALNGEIEYIIETIADEGVVYDTANYFAYPDTKNLKSLLKDDKAKEIIDHYNESFKKVYDAYNFGNSHDGWHYFKKLLIDGFLAFEIIYDTDTLDNANNVIGFKELDPISLEPEMRYDSKNNQYRVWVQYRGDMEKQRELLDSNLVYISWARGNFNTRISYVERLVRVFNLLRTMENTRIIWNVQNAQKRVKIGIPIGGMSDTKAKARIDEFRALYKEDVNVDYQSGELTYNGQAKFPFAKTYVIPSKDGQQIEIGEIASEGYDMNSTEQLKYFWNRFIIESKLPKDRFSNLTDGNGVTSNETTDSISKDELRFSYFLSRIRAIFKEILLKPAWIQFCLKYPEFQNDDRLRNAIGLIYVDENIFKLAKERQLAEKGATVINSLMSIKEPMILQDGSMTEMPYFDIKFLLEKYMTFTDTDFALNDSYKKERNEKLMSLQTAYQKLNGGQQNDMGGMQGGMDMSGGFGGDMGGMDMGGDMGMPDIDNGDVTSGMDANFENPK